jgi:predicted nucleotidyltransferase
MFGLKDSQILALNALFSRYHSIDKVILYGSRAKGNYKNGSDIDLTILDHHMNHTELLRLETEMDDLLLPYKIDLSLFRQIDNPNLIDHIEKVGKLFYDRVISLMPSKN